MTKKRVKRKVWLKSNLIRKAVKWKEEKEREKTYNVKFFEKGKLFTDMDKSYSPVNQCI